MVEFVKVKFGDPVQLEVLIFLDQSVPKISTKNLSATRGPHILTSVSPKNFNQKSYLV